MQCEKCGEPVTMTDDNGVTTPGETFVEYHECANGHRGQIKGVVGQSTERWRRTGAVFNGY